MNKIDELLEVLDMPEEEQIGWLLHIKKLSLNKSLADLAFRLRGEAVKTQYERAIRLVEFYLRGKRVGFWNKGRLAYWRKYETAMQVVIEDWLFYIDPIDMIIAALIALELTRKELVDE